MAVERAPGQLRPLDRLLDSVADILAQRIGNTLILTVAAAGLAITIGFVGGTLAGIRRFSLFDRASTLPTLIAASAPTFWIGLLLLYVFALELRWPPATGMYPIATKASCSTFSGICRCRRSRPRLCLDGGDLPPRARACWT